MKIAIVMPNWVGDCIMTLPALFFLQKKNYQIYLYGKKWLPQLFAALSDDIFPLEELTSFRKKNNNQKSYCLLFPNSFESAWKARLAKLKPIGYRRDGRSLLLHKSFARKKKHEAEIFYRLAFLCDGFLNKKFLNEDKKNTKKIKSKIKQTEKEINFKINQKYFLPIKKEFEKKVELLLTKFLFKKNYFLLCPLSHNKGNGTSKNYPHWKKLLVQLLQTYPDYQFIFCPGPDETSAITETFAETIQNKKVTIIEKTSLGEYLALLRKARLVIANDSGPMHLASVSNVEVIGLFGVTDPQKTFPIGDKASFLGNKNQWIEVEKVLLKVKEVIAEK